MDSIEPNEQRNTLLSRREFVAGAAAVASTITFAACGVGTPGNTATSKNYTIALVQGVRADPFYVTMQKGAQAMADKLKVKLIVDGPAQFDATLQTSIVDALIAKKVDVIIIAATDEHAMIAPLKRANDAGIKIISVDTFIGDGDYTKGPVTFPLSYIGSDNTQGGIIAGQALIKAIGGKGKVYLENVQPGVSTTDERELGCRNAIQATNGAVILVAVDHNGDSAAMAAQKTAAILQRVPDLAGIFGTNLDSSEGAAQAVKNANKQGLIKIANFDAPESAITDLRRGVVDLVIAQRPAEMGSIAVQYAFDALNGNTNTIKKRFPTDYVIIDRANVDSPEAQAAIYKSS